MNFLRKNKKLAIAFFVIPLFLSIFFWKNCFSQEGDLIELTSETWSGQKILDGNYITDEQQMIFIEKGTEVIFTENSSLHIKFSVLDAVGTVKEPIVFRSASGEPNGYHIFIDDSSGVYLKNVDISGGGTLNQEEDSFLTSKLVKKARAEQTKFGALTKTGGGTLILDNCYLHNNTIALKLFSLNNFSSIAVNRNRFFDNNTSVIEENNETSLDFRYNWWERDNIQGLVNDNNSKFEKNFKDPVIIIPGIMGSAEKDKEWEMDPIFGTYDDLIRAFKKEGYVLEKDLFVFPYQWRDSNVDNAIILKNKIQEIKDKTNSNKVDLVAHSMGGLLAREYLEADDYWFRDDIDQFITLGTPHQGAPEVYSVWEAGDFIANFMGLIKRSVFKQEAEEAGYDSLFKYVRSRPISSVKELLPTYKYLWDKDFKKYKKYPEEHPKNEFLESLNSAERIESLQGIEFVNIYGQIEDISTIAEYKVINETVGELWEHGYPNGFDNLLPVGDRGMVQGLGDKTVPIVSALYPSEYATYNLKLNSNHGDLPTNAQQDVLEFLTGKRPEEKIEENSKIKSLLSFFVFSPIDIQVVLEDGRRIGTDFETGESINELEDLGAYYTGNNTENEFITIPNYLEGKYKILTSGADSGEFRIEVTSFKDNNEYEAEEEQIKEIKGETFLDEIQSFEFVVGDENDENNDETESDTKILLDETGDGNDDEDEKKEDDEDEDDQESEEAPEQVESLLIQNFAETDLSQQNSTERGAEQEIVDKKIIKEEKQPQTKIAGDQNRKNNYWMIILIFLVGGIALFLTWTVNWTFKKKIVKMKKP